MSDIDIDPAGTVVDQVQAVNIETDGNLVEAVEELHEDIIDRDNSKSVGDQTLFSVGGDEELPAQPEAIPGAELSPIQSFTSESTELEEKPESPKKEEVEEKVFVKSENEDDDFTFGADEINPDANVQILRISTPPADILGESTTESNYLTNQNLDKTSILSSDYVESDNSESEMSKSRSRKSPSPSKRSNLSKSSKGSGDSKKVKKRRKKKVTIKSDIPRPPSIKTKRASGVSIRNMTQMGTVSQSEFMHYRETIIGLQKQLFDAKKEVRQMKQIQVQHERSLNRLDNRHTSFDLIRQHSEETRVVREQLRLYREKIREQDRILRERNDLHQRTLVRVKQLESALSGVKGGKKGSKRIRDIENELLIRDMKIKELEHHSNLLVKNHKHQLGIEVMRHRDTQRKLAQLEDQVAKLRNRHSYVSRNAVVSSREPLTVIEKRVDDINEIVKLKEARNKSDTEDVNTSRSTISRRRTKPFNTKEGKMPPRRMSPEGQQTVPVVIKEPATPSTNRSMPPIDTNDEKSILSKSHTTFDSGNESLKSEPNSTTASTLATSEYELPSLQTKTKAKRQKVNAKSRQKHSRPFKLESESPHPESVHSETSIIGESRRSSILSKASDLANGAAKNISVIQEEIEEKVDILKELDSNAELRLKRENAGPTLLEAANSKDSIIDSPPKSKPPRPITDDPFSDFKSRVDKSEENKDFMDELFGPRTIPSQSKPSVASSEFFYGDPGKPKKGNRESSLDELFDSVSYNSGSSTHRGPKMGSVSRSLPWNDRFERSGPV